jgi:hypothetical protein
MDYAGPKMPMVMTALSVRARVVMNMLAMHCYLLAVIVLALMHGYLCSSQWLRRIAVSPLTDVQVLGVFVN